MGSIPELFYHIRSNDKYVRPPKNVVDEMKKLPIPVNGTPSGIEVYFGGESGRTGSLVRVDEPKIAALMRQGAFDSYELKDSQR